MKEFRTGVDIVEVARIEKALERHGERFLKRVFTDEEVAYCTSKKMTAQRLAARFAAKEAVFKAASPLERLEYKQIEIIHDEGGSPEVKIHNAKVIRSSAIRISLSHTAYQAIASVFLIIED